MKMKDSSKYGPAMYGNGVLLGKGVKWPKNIDIKGKVGVPYAILQEKLKSKKLTHSFEEVDRLAVERAVEKRIRRSKIVLASPVRQGNFGR
jgi:hypothetical protein